MKKITTIGNFTIDDVILYDEKRMHLESIGGNALFSAVGAHIWEVEPTIHARIGRNFPKSKVEGLKNIGIFADMISVPHNDIRDWGLYEPGGARQFVNHLSSGSRYDVSITGPDLNTHLLKGDGVHLAPMPTDVQFTVLETIDKAKGKETVVSWDPHEDYLVEESFNEMARSMLQHVDIFLPSTEEVKRLFGSEDFPAIAREAAKLGPKIVAIKKSVEGSLLYIKDTQTFYDIPIYPSDTVDPTGAGDTFCGGFLASYIKDEDPVLAAACATVSASYVVEKIGAFATLDSDFSDRDNRLEYVTNQITKI